MSLICELMVAGFLVGGGVIGGFRLIGELDRLETVLVVRLDRVEGVESPDDDDGAGVVGRVDGVGTDAEDGVGTVIVCRRLAPRFVLSISSVAAFCCLFLRSVVMLCTCFSPVVSFLLVSSFAV